MTSQKLLAKRETNAEPLTAPRVGALTKPNEPWADFPYSPESAQIQPPAFSYSSTRVWVPLFSTNKQKSERLWGTVCFFKHVTLT